MSRRSRPTRNSVLGSAYERARLRADYLCKQSVHAMVRPDFDKHDAFRWLFPDYTREALATAYQFSSPDVRARQYKTPAMGAGSVWIEFSDMETLVPSVEAVEPDPLEYPRLIAVMDDVWKISRDFALVKHVLAWLDENGTAGAMRYYFPSVALLALGFEVGNCPVSFREPYGIEKLVPMIREAARILAQSQLIPEQETPARGLSLPYSSTNTELFGQTVSVSSLDFYI